MHRISRWLYAMTLFVLFLPLPVRAAEPVTIAAVFSITGIAASHNAPLLPVVRLAVDEINAGGGLLGQPVRLVFIDNKSSSLGSAAAAEESVRQGATAVIGALWSSHSLAMAPILQKAGMPMISPGSTNPEVTKIGDYIFRVCFIDSFQGRAMASFARSDLGARKAVIMTNIDEPYSIALASYFRKGFTNLGGVILHESDYRGKSVDFSENLAVLKELAPDAVYVPGYTRDSGLLIRQAASSGIEGVFLGGDAWDEIYTVAGDALKGSYQSAPWHSQAPYPQSRHLRELYRHVFKQEISSTNAPLAYDAVMVLADAIARAGSTDRRKIRDAVAASNFLGATGVIAFDENGDPRDKEVVILRFDAKGISHYVKSIRPQ
ncbi:MAG: ABC transporter substrate-binding protein [Deltaproteobacteria bacterium]|nr:ABC transporter substrate-binding protein [Deltaproteobacteria bacterium]